MLFTACLLEETQLDDNLNVYFKIMVLALAAVGKSLEIQLKYHVEAQETKEKKEESLCEKIKIISIW